jgi:hypothetical protein
MRAVQKTRARMPMLRPAGEKFGLSQRIPLEMQSRENSDFVARNRGWADYSDWERAAQANGRRRMTLP